MAGRGQKPTNKPCRCCGTPLHLGVNYAESRLRQAHYICNSCISSRQNLELNAVSRIAYQIAGSSKKFYKLDKAKRLEVRAAARKLHEQGLEVAAAAKRAAAAAGRAGFVYVIIHPAWPHRVKIGSALDVDSRLADYQTYAPDRAYRVLHTIYSDDRNEAERTIHTWLADKRLLGEWFAMDPREACSVLDEYAQREAEDNQLSEAA